MVRISGFGQDGPYSQRAGLRRDQRGGQRPAPPDGRPRPAAGARRGVDDRLHHRPLCGVRRRRWRCWRAARTGRGQVHRRGALRVRLQLHGAVGVRPTRSSATSPTRTGSRLPESTPNNLYATGDGDFIHITAMADAVFRRLVEAMGQPRARARTERFATALARSANDEALDDIIARWTAAAFARVPRARARARVNVPATRIYTIADIFGDPHYKARQSIVAAPDPDLGSGGDGHRRAASVGYAGRHPPQRSRTSARTRARVLARTARPDDAQLDALGRRRRDSQRRARTGRRGDERRLRPLMDTKTEPTSPNASASCRSSRSATRRRSPWAARTSSPSARPPACSTRASGIDAAVRRRQLHRVGPVRHLG